MVLCWRNPKCGLIVYLTVHHEWNGHQFYMHPTTLYNIQNDDYYFTTGCSSHRQFLIGFQLPNLILLTFDLEGNFLTLSLKDVAGRIPSLSAGNLYVSSDAITVEAKKWANELNMTLQTISVKQFSVPEYWIGIKELPDHYQDVLNNPSEYGSDLNELYEEIDTWRKRGDYVFYWNEDYYMSKEGEVIST